MKNSLSSQAEEDALAEEVAGWFLRMQEGDCSEDDRRAFEAWLAASDTHREEYRQYEALWNNLDQLGTVPVKKSRGKSGSILGALVGVAVAALAAQWYLSLGEVITTAVGERRHVVLVDGTAIDLNTDSKIRVKLEEGLRRITLESGEVLLQVARDTRPFEVHAGDGILRDIGTTFNVRREDETTNVAVLEGEVKVSLHNTSTVNLRGGQQVDYAAHSIFTVSQVDPADTTAWLNGRLIFRDTPLQEVVKQINRYHTRPIELANEKLGSLKVSGEFNSADRDGLLQALKILFPLKSTEHIGSTELSGQI